MGARAVTLYAWTVSGEGCHEGSSDPWRTETADGVIDADCAGQALEKIVNAWASRRRTRSRGN